MTRHARNIPYHVIRGGRPYRVMGCYRSDQAAAAAVRRRGGRPYRYTAWGGSYLLIVPAREGMDLAYAGPDTAPGTHPAMNEAMR